jgi:hypothetical protein
LGCFSHRDACKSSLENTKKMSLMHVLNKTLPWAHMELELDVHGIPDKLVKYVNHMSKRKNWKNLLSSYKLSKLQSTSFWSQGILGVKVMGTSLLYYLIVL